MLGPSRQEPRPTQEGEGGAPGDGGGEGEGVPQDGQQARRHGADGVLEPCEKGFKTLGEWRTGEL